MSGSITFRGQIDADKIPASSDHAKLKPADRGPCEEVDPITAAIAISSSSGLRVRPEQRPDPAGRVTLPGSPQFLSGQDLQRIEADYNNEKNPKGTTEENKFTVVRATRHPDGKVIALIQESRETARRRWQNELAAKSFHSAIFDSRTNHSQVTAYDVAIGSGKASSDPKFYSYLCAVADWRLKKPGPKDNIRPGIMIWGDFVAKFVSSAFTFNVNRSGDASSLKAMPRITARVYCQRVCRYRRANCGISSCPKRLPPSELMT